MQRLKSILPSLKEKKRYMKVVAYNIDDKVSLNLNMHRQELKSVLNNFLGIKKSAQAGLKIINVEANEMLIRVRADLVKDVQMAFLMLSKLGVDKVIFRTVKVFGTIKKSKTYRWKNGTRTTSNDGIW